MDFTIPLVETTWLLMTVSMVGVLLRRELYAWFQYSHKYIGVVFYVSAIVHSWSFW
jgi:hypothetical protein